MENLRNQRIKYALKKAKISQQELADALNLTDSAVNQRLNSEKPVDSIEFIEMVCRLTNVDRDYLINGDELKVVTEPKSNYEKLVIKKDFDKESWSRLITSRVLYLMERIRFDTNQFSQMMGLKPKVFRSKLENNDWDIQDLERMAQVTRRSVSFFTKEDYDIENDEVINQERKMLGYQIRTLSIVVDKEGNELIPFVPVKAQAGYTKGFGDDIFLGTLQTFSIPNLRNGTYRMFEVDGDSMLQITGGGLHDGDIVIAQYLENFYDVRDNRVYVVVSKEGIVIKRLINRLRSDNPVIVCKSDNKSGAYPDFLLRPEDLYEIWELKAYISKQLSFNTDLWQMLSEMQTQQALLAEKLSNLEKKAG